MATKTKSEAFLDKKNRLKEVKLEADSGSELLLLNMPKEDYSILRTIGLDAALTQAENKQDEINAIKGLEDTYGGKTYLASDIKELCNIYDLSIMRAEQYYGGVNMEMAKAIKEFTENKKAKVGLSINNFFILAPREDFKKASKGNSFAIFYRESDNRAYVQCDKYNNDRLIKIYSCGKDYSWIREFNYFLCNELGIALIITFGVLLIILIVSIINDTTEVIAVFSVIWAIIFIIAASNGSNITDYRKLWNHKYNSDD